MSDTAAVIAAAERLKDKDEEALLVELGLRQNAITANPELADQPDLQLSYDSTLMGPLDEIKRIGRKILVRWSKELHNVVCGTSADDTAGRKKVLDALSLGEAAMIGAVAGALLALGVPPPLAAALAPLIVRKFIMPAGEEVCSYWGEALNAAK